MSNDIRLSLSRLWQTSDETDESQQSILFVCTGNICRSAYGHHHLAHLLHSAVPGAFEVRSAGTGINPRLRVPEEIRALADPTVLSDLESHEPRTAFEPLVCDAQLILTATTHHSDVLIDQTPAAHSKTFTVLEFAALAPRAADPSSLKDLVSKTHALRAGRSKTERRSAEFDIPDPYGRDEAAYRAMADQLQPAIDTIARVLIDMAKAR